MKFLSYVAAAFAVAGIVLQPITPAFAARSDSAVTPRTANEMSAARTIVAEQTLDEFLLDAQINPGVREKLAGYAARGEVAILSVRQMQYLERTHPQLYAKLMQAYRTASTPNLNPEEKRLVDLLSGSNVAAFKAGVAPCGTSGTGIRGVDAYKVASLTAVTREGCGSSNMTGAWVILGLVLTVIIVVPLFCAIATQLGTAPAFCRGMSGP